MEKRAYQAIWETKAQADALSIVVGYAALYDTLSVDLGGFRERILPGAFARALAADADVRALINHDESLLLGRTLSGTLVLSDDQRGLRVQIALPNTTYARDLVVLLERGDISQMSFAFRAVRDRFIKEGGEVVRELAEVELYDVSVVTYPAYPETTADLRSRAGAARFYDPIAYRYLIQLRR
jgi:HK97 family phage prohead protease